MEFRLLGGVELWSRGTQLELPSTKLKQLLAALLWDPNQMVSAETLVRRMWDEDAPPRELASLQANVSRLRAVLRQCRDPGAQLDHVPFGYRLLVPEESIDTVQFRRDRAQARAEADRGRIDEAIRLLRSAEALVHGEPLAGLPGDWAARKRVELREETRDVTLLRIELQLNVHPEEARDLLAELRGSAAEHEFDESVLELYMRALHLAGRTTDALHVYGEFRMRLREHSGLDPRASTRRLYEQLLKDEPADSEPASASATTLRAATLPLTVSVSARPAPAAVPNTLDRDPPGFVGRNADVTAITAEVEGRLGAGETALVVIDGMPGIGKSTLALYAAHRLRRHCPDGALQLHLRGHDEHVGPTAPEAALDVLTGMLGATPREIQRSHGLDHAIALWRRYVLGKRLLLLLDDASEAEQVLPLIPTGPGCIVLVTARTRLTDLPGAARHALEPMDDVDAATLFVSAARMSSAISDPAMRDVVAACDGFPLALAVAGNTLRMRESWSIADLAEDLAFPHPAGQPDSVIAPAISRTVATSYRDLPEIERRILRRLALNPGTRIHLHAVAALADATHSEANHALFQLVSKNLILETPRHFYQLHDMMRLFAEHACAADETAEDLDLAAERLTLHTLGAVESATRLFHPHRYARLVEVHADPGDGRYESGFSTAAEAAAWLDSQQEWLRAIARSWFAHDRALHAAALSHMLAKYLDRRSLWKEGIELHQRSLDVWRDLGNTTGQAYARTDLAAAHWRLGSGDKTLLHAGAALELWSALDDEPGQADALLQLARAYLSARRYPEAISCSERCADLRLATKDQHGQAAALQHLGVALYESGKHRAGIDRTLSALDLSPASRDETMESYCINNLGEFHARIGDFDSAEAYFREALPLIQKFGESHSIGVVVVNLGDAQTRLGRPSEALPLLERAGEIFDSDDEFGRMILMTAKARAHLALGRRHSVRGLLEQAYESAERLDDLRQIASICLINGDAYCADGDHVAAALVYRQALEFARRADSSPLQGVVCHRIGDNAAITGDRDIAKKYWRRAVDLYLDAYTTDAAALRARLAWEQ